MPSTRCWYFMNPSGGYARLSQGSSCLPALRTSIEQGAIPFFAISSSPRAHCRWLASQLPGCRQAGSDPNERDVANPLTNPVQAEREPPAEKHYLRISVVFGQRGILRGATNQRVGDISLMWIASEWPTITRSEERRVGK